jgi:hypothetical protein
MDDVEFQDGGYYYPMSNNEYPAHLNHSRGFAKVTLNISSIILVPKTLWKRFEANIKWKLIEPKLDEMIKLNEKSARATYGMQYNLYPFTRLKQFADMSGPVGDFAKKTLQTTPDEWMGMRVDEWDLQLCRLGLGKLGSNQPQAEFKMLLDKYPLLKLDNTSKEMKQAFVDYITLIDNASKE